VEAQNDLKRVDAGCVTLLRQGHAAHFSFMPMVEVTGLKTYRGPKRKEGALSDPSWEAFANARFGANF